MPPPPLIAFAAGAHTYGLVQLVPGAPLPAPLPPLLPPLLLPVAGMHVRAGFTSPADDFLDKRIDLNQVLITHPQATFLLRVAGDSMRDAGIHDGDTLVVNRALKPRHGHIVVATLDGEFTVKYLHQRAGRTRLRPANPTFPDIVPREGQTIEVVGVVTSAITRFVK